MRAHRLRQGAALTALTAISIAATAQAGLTPKARSCIYTDTCPDPKPPPPPPPPTLPQCQAATPATMPAGCDKVLGQEMARLASTTAGRPMFNVDGRGYPYNLASTTSTNLVSGPFAVTDPTRITLFDSQLSYEGAMARDWNAANGNLVSAARDLTHYAPHPWYSPGHAPPPADYWGYTFGDTIQHGCAEFTWKLWQPLTFLEDQVAACGGDAACSAAVLLQGPWGLPRIVDANTGALRIAPVAAYRSLPTTDRMPLRDRSNPLFARNDFFAVSPSILDDQTWAILQSIAPPSGYSCGGWPARIGPAVTGSPYVPQDARLKTPQAQQAFAAIRQLLQARYQVQLGYGKGAPPPNTTVYSDELDYDTRMSYGTVGNLSGSYWSADPSFVPLPVAQRRAIRDRALRLRELVEKYDQMNSYYCAGFAPPSDPIFTVQHVYSADAGKKYGDVPIGTATAGTSSAPAMRATAATRPAHGVTAMGSAGGGGAGTGGSDPRIIQANTAMQTSAAVQEQILELLYDEYNQPNHGCFNTTSTGHFECDWFAEDFLPAATTIARTERESDFQMCETWLGDGAINAMHTDVNGASSAIDTAIQVALKNLTNAPGIAPSIDPGKNSNWESAATTPASDGARDAFGQVFAGGKHFGDDDTFGAHFEYGVYWRVAPHDFHGTTNGSPDGTPRARELDGDVHAGFRAGAELFKTAGDAICKVCMDVAPALAAEIEGAASRYVDVDKAFDKSQFPEISACPQQIVDACKMRYRFQHLADLDASLQVRPPGSAYGASQFSGHFFFAGEQLWNDKVAIQDIHQSWPGQPIDVKGVNTTIWVLSIPVTFDVHGEVNYGATYDQTLAGVIVPATVSDVSPTLEAHLKFDPYVFVDAFGTAEIGFSGAGAGVRGRVRVIDAHMPLRADAKAQDGTLTFHSDAHIDLHYLAGSMSVFAELLGWTAEKEIASWNGYNTVLPIWRLDPQPIALPILTKGDWDSYTKLNLE